MAWATEQREHFPANSVRPKGKGRDVIPGRTDTSQALGTAKMSTESFALTAVVSLAREIRRRRA
ncbi:hypothetical protein [Actinomadura litoris]|uniref:hypothetical protein n=1 Tax=Actinomadura litoris TaxID=2678616 RepID=UPI001FA7B492|nr:hypothetical protein [Actinomadura litoris]